VNVVEQLVAKGFAIVESVLDRETLEQTRARMYAVRDCIVREVGEERLQRAGELGVLRLMMRFDPFFFRFLEIPDVLAVVDATVSATAILHLQNGFILPSLPSTDSPRVSEQLPSGFSAGSERLRGVNQRHVRHRRVHARERGHVGGAGDSADIGSSIT